MIVVDNFAGGGGASTGIEAALGRPIDYAINHDPEAIAMHRINHPGTEHLVTNVMDVDPVRLARGRRIGLAWFSPDCTFHSKARGGKPFRDRDIARRRRGLAWSVTTWAKLVRPEVIMLENVEEFGYWGPLNKDGTIDQKRKGSTFRKWVAMLQNLGYAVDMRELVACNYGAPTTRKRLFVVARRDGQEIIFPEATHGPGLQRFATAADCIDWSIPCPSIFTRSRPLAEATLRRIARGVMRYCVNNPNPFIVQAMPTNYHDHTGHRRDSVVDLAPFIANTRNGERAGQAPRVRSPLDPLPTVTAQGSQGALVAAFLAQHNTGMTGHRADTPISTLTSKGSQQQLVMSHLTKFKGTNTSGIPIDEPLHTVQAKGWHYGEVRAFLMSYYGTQQNPSLKLPAPTVRTRDHLGLVIVRGEPYQIVDIGMRMLTARELFRAQSFADSYIIDRGLEEDGRIIQLNKTAQVRMCGNSVPPLVAEALVRANLNTERARQVA